MLPQDGRSRRADILRNQSREGRRQEKQKTNYNWGDTSVSRTAKLYLKRNKSDPVWHCKFQVLAACCLPFLTKRPCRYGYGEDGFYSVTENVYDRTHRMRPLVTGIMVSKCVIKVNKSPSASGQKEWTRHDARCVRCGNNETNKVRSSVVVQRTLFPPSGNCQPCCFVAI